MITKAGRNDGNIDDGRRCNANESIEGSWENWRHKWVSDGNGPVFP